MMMSVMDKWKTSCAEIARLVPRSRLFARFHGEDKPIAVVSPSDEGITVQDSFVLPILADSAPRTA